MLAERRLSETLLRDDSTLGCAVCPAREHNLCDAYGLGQALKVESDRIRIPQSGHTVKARRRIVHDVDFHDAVPIICSGWAASISLFPDGRRQILSFLLPGDIVSTGLVFGSKPVHVEAITNVRYRTFKRRELKSLLFKQSGLLDSMLARHMVELVNAERLVVDLGLRSGEERIARLFLSIAQRLKDRDMMSSPTTVGFPLRQHHIADATGLTQVHVNKIISEFRRSGLIDFRERTLLFLDIQELRRRANLSDRPECPKPAFYGLSAA